MATFWEHRKWIVGSLRRCEPTIKTKMYFKIYSYFLLFIAPNPLVGVKSTLGWYIQDETNSHYTMLASEGQNII